MKNFIYGLIAGIILGLSLFIGGAMAYKTATTFEAGTAPIEELGK